MPSDYGLDQNGTANLNNGETYFLNIYTDFLIRNFHLRPITF